MNPKKTIPVVKNILADTQHKNIKQGFARKLKLKILIRRGRRSKMSLRDWKIIYSFGFGAPLVGRHK